MKRAAAIPADSPSAGRPNQRHRTRQDLLHAAARLMKHAPRPSLEEIAVEAMVSRATAYRYFPHVDALLAEASLDIAAPVAEAIFPAGISQNPVIRVELVDRALQEMMLANESQLRTMLAHSVTRSLGVPDATVNVPRRQNRRTPLLEAALEPARAQFTPVSLRRLVHALAMFISTEGMIVAKDVLQISDAEAQRVKQWAIRALIEAARDKYGARRR